MPPVGISDYFRVGVLPAPGGTAGSRPHQLGPVPRLHRERRDGAGSPPLLSAPSDLRGLGPEGLKGSGEQEDQQDDEEQPAETDAAGSVPPAPVSKASREHEDDEDDQQDRQHSKLLPLAGSDDTASSASRSGKRCRRRGSAQQLGWVTPDLGVARDRISTADPEARHGQESHLRRFDGYETHARVDADSELVDEVAVTRPTRDLSRRGGDGGRPCRRRGRADHRGGLHLAEPGYAEDRFDIARSAVRARPASLLTATAVRPGRVHHGPAETDLTRAP